MINSEVSASEFLRDLSQRTSYLFEWRQSQRKTPSQPSRKLSLQELAKIDHVSLNKRGIKREPSKRYGLKEWEGRHNMIHRVQYPLLNDDPDTAEQAFFMSKLAFNEAHPLPYAVINFNSNLTTQHKSNNLIEKEIAKAQREIIIRREAELQKVVMCRTQMRPKDKLLPSIPIKRSHPERTPIVIQQRPSPLAPPKQPNRKLSLPYFQQQQDIIKLIQF